MFIHLLANAIALGLFGKTRAARARSRGRIHVRIVVAPGEPTLSPTSTPTSHPPGNAPTSTSTTPAPDVQS
jgi:hypothetical protein